MEQARQYLIMLIIIIMIILIFHEGVRIYRFHWSCWQPCQMPIRIVNERLIESVWQNHRDHASSMINSAIVFLVYRVVILLPLSVAVSAFAFIKDLMTIVDITTIIWTFFYRVFIYIVCKLIHLSVYVLLVIPGHKLNHVRPRLQIGCSGLLSISIPSGPKQS